MPDVTPASVTCNNIERESMPRQPSFGLIPMPWKVRTPIPPRTEFERWTVLRPGPIYVAHHRDGRRQTHSTSVCRCSCPAATEAIIKNGDLKNGKSRSCGCIRVELQMTHGQSRRGQIAQIFTAWQGMIQRCENPSSDGYADYGRRGIGVFPEWRRFEPFFEFMGPGKKGWSIHRVDNDAGYFPENMVWALPEFQMRHTRANHIVTVRGITGCLVELCERFGKPYGLVSSRINTLGWPVERAFFVPKYGWRLMSGRWSA